MKRTTQAPQALSIPSNFVSRSSSALGHAAAVADSKSSWFRMEKGEASPQDDTASHEVYIYGEIGESWWGDSVSASDFVKALNELEAKEGDQVNFHINSPGGSVFEGLAIYNAIRNSPAHTTVFVDGMAASAASFIAQAADEVVMNQGSMMMIHDAIGAAYGNKDVMAEVGGVLEKISQNIASIYAARSGEDVETIRAMMTPRDTWFTDAEAVEFGLADRVSETKAETTEKEAKSLWKDAFANFTYAGRSEAPDPKTVLTSVTNKATPASTPKEPVVAGSTSNASEFSFSMGDKTFTSPETLQAHLTSIQEAADRGQTVFVINGTSTQDFGAVQSHISSLETAMTEITANARNEFVEKLAASNKISAGQIVAQQNFAATLSDEQYKAWTEGWEASPVLPTLMRHAGGGGSNPEGDGSTDAARIAELEDTVAYMRRSLSPEALAKTPAAMELAALQAKTQS